MNGMLGKAMSVANTSIKLYEVPATQVMFSTVTLNALNRGGSDATIRVAIGTGNAPDPADYIEDGGKIPANGGVFSRSCNLLSPGEKYFVEVDSSNVALRLEGLEKAI
jgi:hypothetical protein